MAIRGSCLCRAVTFTIDAPVTMMGHCHCSMCRKAHGAPFSTYVFAPEGSLHLEGADNVQRRRSSTALRRAFCRHCGSVTPSGDAASGFDLAPAALLDDDPGVLPQYHLFVRSKLPWYDIADDLPQHDAYQSGWGAEIPSVRHTEPSPGKVRGSCLCGSVTYEVDGEIEGPIIFCHCGRCRKARAAAHAANCFVDLDRFRWLSGADLVTSYKVPEAKVFHHDFCSLCGGGVARVSPERGKAIIPTPALDDDPGAHPEMHIFVGSKAPWFAIADDLPQWQEGPPGPYPPSPTQR